MNEENLKMYCITSKESLNRMKGIRGKMMSQSGHAFLHAFWDAQKRFPEQAHTYQHSMMATKITLVVDTDEKLLAIFDKYKEKMGATCVIDAGLTVTKGPTLTCIGLGPVYPSFFDEDVSSLKTLT